MLIRGPAERFVTSPNLGGGGGAVPGAAVSVRPGHCPSEGRFLMPSFALLFSLPALSSRVAQSAANRRQPEIVSKAATVIF